MSAYESNSDKAECMQRVNGRVVSNGTRKITVECDITRALSALINGEGGAEYDVAILATAYIANGMAVPPALQSVFNAIMAKAMLEGALPPKRRGRPPATSEDVERAAAFHYYKLLDSGAGYANSVESVARILCKDERHAMRLVSRGKDLIGGDDPIERERFREKEALMQRMSEAVYAEGPDREPYQDCVLRLITSSSESPPDYRQVLDRQIEVAIQQWPPPDIK